jgi:UDP-N-acetylmuramyl pentapeptide synthase
MGILVPLLATLARLILRRYRPQVVGITGSVGKTSTKEAVAVVLGHRRRVRRSVKSYNNEIGLPLTVIGAAAPGRSFVGWAGVVRRALRLVLWRDDDYPELLVLEMAADKPGDIAYLTAVAPCDVGVLTAIAPAHLQGFKTLERLTAEKRLVVSRLRPGGAAVLNRDDELVMKTSAPEGVSVLTYGFGERADVRGSEVALSFDPSGANDLAALRGTSFKVSHAGSTVPVLLPCVVGRPPVLAALAAAAVGLHAGLNLVEIAEALQSYRQPPGRLNLLSGMNGSIVVDDTYNASPAAALAALDTLASLPVRAGGKRYAVFGDMLELGAYAEEGHAVVGRRVAERHPDALVTVGEAARTIAREARLAGVDASAIFSFAAAEEAHQFLAARLQSGDVVLVKGSEKARLERLVKDLLVDPERAGELLVRQEPAWQKR